MAASFTWGTQLGGVAALVTNCDWPFVSGAILGVSALLCAMEEASVRLVQTFLTCAECETGLSHFTLFDKLEFTTSFFLVVASTSCLKTH